MSYINEWRKNAKATPIAKLSDKQKSEIFGEKERRRIEQIQKDAK